MENPYQLAHRKIFSLTQYELSVKKYDLRNMPGAEDRIVGIVLFVRCLRIYFCDAECNKGDYEAAGQWYCNSSHQIPEQTQPNQGQNGRALQRGQNTCVSHLVYARVLQIVLLMVLC